MSGLKSIDQNDKASAWRHAIDTAIGTLMVIVVPALMSVGDKIIEAIQTGQISLIVPDWKAIGAIILSAAIAGAIAGGKRLWERYRLDLSKLNESQS